MLRFSILATLLFALVLCGCDSSADAPESDSRARSNSTLMDDDDYEADLFGDLNEETLEENATTSELDEPGEDNEGFDEPSVEIDLDDSF